MLQYFFAIRAGKDTQPERAGTGFARLRLRLDFAEPWPGKYLEDEPSRSVADLLVPTRQLADHRQRCRLQLSNADLRDCRTVLAAGSRGTFAAGGEQALRIAKP
jgi:hypothetical protein